MSTSSTTNTPSGRRADQALLKQHFSKRDGHYDMTAAAAFLMMAGYAYDPKESPTPGLRERADEILAGAARAGFAQSDVFTTLLAQVGISARTLRMAIDVTAAVGGDAAMFELIRVAPNAPNQ
ncbi:hypothetical protein ASF61_16905 [Duganella sp. Leaf126]|uniref:hypothetical protein n=1 Tax=Duganella sp. Leaf126 TaxID=1736266 RepID=UPI0006FB4341|nr:hypothetical protein [Duganella sp. Leaf126]KQQ32013.1 hypothetical protein ASF61_16905 [Duganella sp. Leaf126]